jgi:hypothetical protein
MPTGASEFCLLSSEFSLQQKGGLDMLFGGSAGAPPCHARPTPPLLGLHASRFRMLCVQPGRIVLTREQKYEPKTSY